MRNVLWVGLLLGACSRSNGSAGSEPPRDASEEVSQRAPQATTRDARDASADSSASSSMATADGDRDFLGSFAGSNLFGTLRITGTVVDGSLFYEHHGVDIPLVGVLRDGALTLHEMENGRAISTITLSSDREGWSGTWQEGTRRGDAFLVYVVREPGEPVVVATRTLRTTSPPCEGTVRDGMRTVRATTTVRSPWVLGLADRAFQRKLNARLRAAADASDACPFDVDVSFRVPLNSRGFLSVLFTKSLSPTKGVEDAPVHDGEAAGLTAAVDAAVIAGLGDFANPKRLGAALPPEVRHSDDECVARDDQPVDPLSHLQAFVLTTEGAEYCYWWCVNHSSGSTCGQLPYRTFRAALKPDSRFAPLWKGGDAGE